MKSFLKILAAAGLLAIAPTGTAVAAALSSCSGPPGGIVCDLYEEDANGNPSEIGWLVPLPSDVGTGTIVILEPGGDLNDPKTVRYAHIWQWFRRGSYAHGATGQQRLQHRHRG